MNAKKWIILKILENTKTEYFFRVHIKKPQDYGMESTVSLGEFHVSYF